MTRGTVVAFVAGLSDRKLAQKLLPIASMDSIERIDLYRRRPFALDGVAWRRIPAWAADRPLTGDLWRLTALLAGARHADVLVGCHQRFHGVLAGVAGAVVGRPVVQLLITEVDWVLRRPILAAAIRRADAVGVRGPRALARLRAAGYRGPIEVVANPFTPALNPPPSVEPAHDVLAVGDLAPEKDYPRMLEVLSRVRAARPGTRLAIAGGGDFARSLRPRLESLRLADAVDFLGTLDEPALARARAASRVFLSTSSAEGLPMALLEAMDAARPVVVPAVGEIPWVVEDRRSGRVVPPGDAGAAARAVLEVLDDPALAAGLGAGARERLLALAPEFTVEAIQSRWRALLARVLP